MLYRPATYQDYEKIAQLHARSWQENYRGIYSDDYLDNDVEEDRLKVWQERLQNPKENQHIILAENDGKLCGFACIFLNYDPIWGALIDNLHVLKESKVQGIGRNLMREAAKWVKSQKPDSIMHLWVLEKNYNAQKFYNTIGGENVEMIIEEMHGGGTAEVLRYVWRDLEVLL